MEKEKPCPLCNYPMTPEIKRKSKAYRAKVEYWTCGSCKHIERTPSVTESMKLENELKAIENEIS